MRHFLNSFYLCFATGFGSGYAPAPGTVASLCALLIGYFLPWPWLVGCALGASVLGVWVSHHAITLCHKQDPAEVVIDEYAGMWIALALVPHHWLVYLCAFALFRVLDIFKPSVIGMADKHVKGGLGIMLDDWIAGVISGLIVGFFSYLIAVVCQNCVQFSPLT